MATTDAADSWVPQSCTLPTAEQPLRVAEFDALFAGARAVDTTTPGLLSLELEADPATAARAAELSARETACCSFFTFTLTATGGTLRLEVTVPPAHRDVLDALARQAAGAAS